MLGDLINILVPNIAHILELIGIFIVIYSGIKAFGKYALRFFDFSDETIKIEFSQALAMALEFKLGAEILKTLVIRTLEELVIIASIVVLRAALTFIIHWEIESDSKRCTHLSSVKKTGKTGLFRKKSEHDSSSHDA